MSSGNVPPIDVSKLPHDSRGPAVIAAGVVCLLLGTSATALRLYTRIFLVRKVGIDDYMALTAAFFLLGIAVSMFINVADGLGTHIYLLKLPEALVPFLRDFWFGLLFYNIALLFIKLTFLFQYYRIVSQVRKLRLFYVGMMIVIGGWQAAQCFLILFGCFPVERFWDKSIPGTCFMNAAGQDLNAIGNIVTDFVVLVLPLPVLLRLSLRPAQKWSLVGVFCLGFTTCIISIVRRVFLKFTQDLTYSAVEVVCFSTAEVASGITCAALPCFKPFLSRYFPALKSVLRTKLSGKSTKNTSDYYATTGSSTTRTSVHGFGKGPRRLSISKLSISKPYPIRAGANPWLDDTVALKSRLVEGGLDLGPPVELVSPPFHRPDQTRGPPTPPKDAHWVNPALPQQLRLQPQQQHAKRPQSPQWPPSANSMNFTEVDLTAPVTALTVPRSALRRQ